MSRFGATRRIAAAFCIALLTAFAGAGTVGFASNVRSIMMMDACDPQTFNEVLGEGACVRNGGVTFDGLINQLTVSQKAGAWHFTPGQARLSEGQEFQAINHGGEVHTFTHVVNYGGGFVADLNALSGNPVPAPECLDFSTIEFIPPGGSTEPESEEAGTHHYMCCIHPWMRADIIVK